MSGLAGRRSRCRRKISASGSVLTGKFTIFGQNLTEGLLQSLREALLEKGYRFENASNREERRVCERLRSAF